MGRVKRRPHLRQYEIRFRGNPGRDLQSWFDGFFLSVENGEVTILTGPVVDQAALFGVVARIRDLNLELISINPVKGKGE